METLKIHKIVQNYFKPFNILLEHLCLFHLNVTDFVSETTAFKSICPAFQYKSDSTAYHST